jgi:2-octaprenyl-6-methoxyphenol hydroxylase
VREGYSLVWCGKPDDAIARIALSDEAFLHALHDAFGDRLGAFATVGPRRTFPLGLNAVSQPARARTSSSAEFAIGNAAQTLHPVAGQGLNLGLRDAHDLAALFATAERDASLDAAALVVRFSASRRVDRAATVKLTDFMPRVFASEATTVAWGRGLTLALLDVARPLRGLFARQMMNGRR